MLNKRLKGLSMFVSPIDISESPPAEREASGSPLEGGVYRLIYLNVEQEISNAEG